MVRNQLQSSFPARLLIGGFTLRFNREVTWLVDPPGHSVRTDCKVLKEGGEVELEVRSQCFGALMGRDERYLKDTCGKET